MGDPDSKLKLQLPGVGMLPEHSGTRAIVKEPLRTLEELLLYA